MMAVRSARAPTAALTPFMCKACGKCFTLKGNLRRHEKTHTSEKSHVCEVCGKAFFRNSDLTTHMRTHTGEKPFECETCGKGFARISDLRSHERTHLGIKNFVCDHCGRRFARKYDMEKHRRLHTKQSERSASKRPRLSSGSTDSRESESLCCEVSQTTGTRCERRAVVVHQGHYDFLLTCGTLQCKHGEDHASSTSSEDADNSTDSKMDAYTSPLPAAAAVTRPCPVASCRSPGSCNHLKKAVKVRHEDHIDFALEGHLWHPTGGVFESHGTFELLDINQDFLTFYESLEQMENPGF